MSQILFLDDLVRQEEVDSSIYGLKTKDLARLKKIIDKLSFEYPINIPNFFSVPVGFDLSNSQLQESFNILTNDLSEYKIIMARSSDPKESPGKFESHFSLYDPKNPEKSFNNWLDAAKKVKQSGARSIIAQFLADDLEEFPYDRDWDHDGDNLEKIFPTIKSFGGSSTSFFGNSTNILNGDFPILVTCYGLASKIARGDKNVSLIMKGKYREDIINLTHNYIRSSFSDGLQEKIDLILLDNPDRITEIDYHEDCQDTRFYDSDYGLAAFDRIPFLNSKIQELQFKEFEPDVLFNLIGIIKEKLGTDFEIEGNVSKNGINLFQLREYDVPKKNIKELSKVNDEQIIIKPRHESLGWNKFSGDLYVSRKLVDIPHDGIFLFRGDVHSMESFEPLKNYSRLVINAYKSCGTYQASHSFSQTVQTLVELEKQGIEPIALGLDANEMFFNFQRANKDKFMKLDEDILVIKNVTVECNGHNAQIYFNS